MERPEYVMGLLTLILAQTWATRGIGDKHVKASCSYLFTIYLLCWSKVWGQ